MRNLVISLLLSGSLVAAPALAGPSTKSDKVITGIIVGATAAALIAAIANADEVKVYSKPPTHHQPAKRYHKPYSKPHYKHKSAPRHYSKPPRYWKRDRWQRKHWHGPDRYFDGNRRYWQH